MVQIILTAATVHCVDDMIGFAKRKQSNGWTTCYLFLIFVNDPSTCQHPQPAFDNDSAAVLAVKFREVHMKFSLTQAEQRLCDHATIHM